MVRALRPGGRVIVEDIDYHGSFAHPATEATRRHDELTRRRPCATAAIPTSAGDCR